MSTELSPVEGITAMMLVLGWVLTGIWAGWVVTTKMFRKSRDHVAVACAAGCTALFVAFAGSLLTAWAATIAFGY